jgi:uracil-DNA glycosylase
MLLLDSYHCSRYNQNTGVLTAEMLEAVFVQAIQLKRMVEVKPS